MAKVATQLRATAILAVMAGAVCACHGPRRAVTLDITARDGEHRLVEGATVRVGPVVAGQTDSAGRLIAHLQLGVGLRHEVEVTKVASDHYFAPFLDSFSVSPETEDRRVIVAVLYSVPKRPPPASSGHKGTQPPPPQTPAGDPMAWEGEEMSPSPTPSADTLGFARDLGDVAALETDQPGLEGPWHSPDRPEESVDVQPPQNVEIASPGNGLDEWSDQPVRVAPAGESRRQFVHTFHVYSRGHPIAGASVSLGHEVLGRYIPLGESSARGRLGARIAQGMRGNAKVLVAKPGFVSVLRPVAVRPGGVTRIELTTGVSLDFVAQAPAYAQRRGIDGVEIFLGDQRIGRTDPWGVLSVAYRTAPRDLASLRWVAPGYVPAEHRVDYVAGGPTRFGKTFARQAQQLIPLGLAPIRVGGSGDLDLASLETLNHELDRMVTDDLGKGRAGPWVLVPTSAWQRLRERDAARSLESLIVEGWAGTLLNEGVQALLVPTVVVEREAVVFDLSLVSADGRVVAGFRVADQVPALGAERRAEVLTQLLRKGLEGLRLEALERFAFAGHVAHVDADGVSVEMHPSVVATLTPGRLLVVEGPSSDAEATHGERRPVTLRVRAVEGDQGRLLCSAVEEENSSTAVKTSPAPEVNPGEGVRLLPLGPPSTGQEFRLRVISKGPRGTVPLAAANVYVGGRWLGATDAQGEVVTRLAGRAGSRDQGLEVVRHGYSVLRRRVDLARERQLSLELERESAFLQIETEPPLAMVRVDGREIGRSPRSAVLAVDGSPVKIEVGGVPGYRSVAYLYEVGEGTLDLTAQSKVRLPRDHYGAAERSLAAGRSEEAIEQLEGIEATHPDFLRARHRLGELAMTLLDDPARAAGYLAQVTQAQDVSTFVDKRFLLSHVLEGRALVEAARRMRERDTQGAERLFVRAVEVLERVRPFVRYVSEKERDAVRRDHSYSLAQARQGVWDLRPSPEGKDLLVRAWEDVLEDTELEGREDNVRSERLEIAQQQLLELRGYARADRPGAPSVEAL